MTFKEICEKGVTEVIVQSYGYTERGIFNSHFEPFKHLREFKFTVHSYSRGFILDHKWLYFEDENSENFEFDENGRCICFDPELWSSVN